ISPQPVFVSLHRRRRPAQGEEEAPVSSSPEPTSPVRSRPFSGLLNKSQSRRKSQPQAIAAKSWSLDNAFHRHSRVPRRKSLSPLRCGRTRAPPLTRQSLRSAIANWHLQLFAPRRDFAHEGAQAVVLRPPCHLLRRIRSAHPSENRVRDRSSSLPDPAS